MSMNETNQNGSEKKPVLEISATKIASLKPVVLKIYDRLTAIVFVVLAFAFLAYLIG